MHVVNVLSSLDEALFRKLRDMLKIFFIEKKVIYVCMLILSVIPLYIVPTFLHTRNI